MRYGHAGAIWAVALLSGALGSAGAFGATNPCTGFRWNVDHEHALFQTAGQTEVAGRNRASAPVIRADRLYDLSLAPQQDVHFVLRPEKKALTDGAYAGLARLRVASAGLYRISIDKPFWIDVLARGQFVESQDFAGRGGCGAPRKIVVYELPAGSFVLQLSGAISPQVRVVLTRVPAADAVPGASRMPAPARAPAPGSSP